MEVHLSTQATVFLISVITGGIVSLIYDLFRIIRIAINHNTAVTVVEDILYSLMAFAVVISFFMAFNNGIFRLYLATGIVLGFILCHYTLGALIIIQARLIIRLIKLIFKIILTPFAFIYKIICKFLKKLFIFLKESVIIIKDYILEKCNPNKCRRSERASDTRKKRHGHLNKNTFSDTRGLFALFMHNHQSPDKRKKFRKGRP